MKTVEIFNQLRECEGTIFELCNSDSDEIYAFEVKESKQTRDLLGMLVDDVEDFILMTNMTYQKLGKTMINIIELLEVYTIEYDSDIDAFQEI